MRMIRFVLCVVCLVGLVFSSAVNGEGGHEWTHKTQPEPGTTDRSGPRHSVLVQDTRRGVSALLLTLDHSDPRSGQVHYCAPAAALIEGLEWTTEDDEPLELTAVTWDRSNGMVLLAGPSLETPLVEPVSLGDHRGLTTGTELRLDGRRNATTHLARIGTARGASCLVAEAHRRGDSLATPSSGPSTPSRGHGPLGGG